MRKGFFASVAALATGAGVALGQGYPAAVPGNPAGPGAGPGGPPPNSFYGPGAGGYPGGPTGPGPADVPPAGELPLYGQVAGPDSGHPVNPVAPKYGMQAGQLHKAAGGPDRWYFDIEAMVLGVKAMPLPFPLLTAGNVVNRGILGEPGTSVLVGHHIDYGDFVNAGRLTLGVWDAERVCGYELSGFVTEGKTEHFGYNFPATTGGVLARPVLNALNDPPTNDTLLISFPGQFGGSVNVNGRIHLGGAESNLLWNMLYCDRVKFNLLAGIRYVNLEERLEIDSLTLLPAPNGDPTDQTRSFIQDDFFARNQFVGAQLGFQTELRRGRFFMDLTGKVAGGNMNERLAINGLTSRTVVGVTTNTPAGLLAVNSNIGKQSQNEFAYVPEGTVKFGYQWTQRISTYIGGNALYLSKVVRPGENIDPVVNPTFVPVSDVFGQNGGIVRPLPKFEKSDFFAIGGTFGLCVRY